MRVLSSVRRLTAWAALTLALAAAPASAATTQSKASGSWSATATWTSGVPGVNDDVIVAAGHTVTLDADSALVATLTIDSGGKITGTVGSAFTLFVGKGGGVDFTNNGTLDFVDTSFLLGTFGSQPKGYVVLNKSSTWAGTGSWNLYSIDLQSKTLSFAAGTTATLGVAAPTPFANLGTVLSPTTVTWDFTGKNAAFGGTSSQVVPTTGFTHGGITTSGNGSKIVQSGTLTVNGALTVGASTTLDTNSSAVVLKSDLTNNGTVSAGSSTYTFSGGSAQALGGSNGVSVGSLVLNNASGLTVSRTATVGTLLTLTSGVLTTSGASVELVAAASCLTSVSRTSGWVAGNLRMTIPTGTPTCAFELGDGTAYRPITGLAFASVATSFTITASVSQSSGKHPSLLATVLNLGKGVNRYWTMTNNGVGSLFSSYSAVFNFVAGDVDAGAATGSFVVGKYAALLWSKPTVGSRTATSVQITGIASFSDFAVGENGVAGPDHYELALPSASLSCLPATVTVTACSDASSPCTNAATTLSGATAALATSGGTLAASTVIFNASGVATTTLSYPGAPNATAVSVSLSGESTTATNSRQCCPNGSSCSVANSCSSAFNTAGFIVASATGGSAATVPAQTAGTSSGNFVLRAVKTSTITQACEAALIGANTVNWAYECNNPATCSASNLMSLNGGSATTVQRNNNAGVAAYTSVSMTFDANGNAPFTFTFSDVGQATLWATKTVNSAALAGSSNAFVTKPAGFTLTSLQQTAAPNGVNPAAAGAAGAKFVKAGEAFRANVTAVTSGGAATPNFGKEASPEGVLLTRTLVLPGGGASGTLSNASIAGGSFTSGVAAVSNLAFSEVGIITLTPSVADGDYLGAGNVTGAASGNVGRFVPAQFALSGAGVTHRAGLSCSPASNFTYLGENFSLGFTLTAQNLSGATTQNYTGSFAKLDLASAASYNLAGRAGTTAFSSGGGRLALGSTSGSWSNGVGAGLSVTLQATRAATAEGPFDADFGIAPIDSDGAAMAVFDLASASGGALDLARIGTVALRYGRLQLLNAIGAADRPLSLPVRAQWWNGTAWALYTLDSCTTVAASAVSFGNLRRTLSTADTAVSAGVALVGGVGTLRLAAPGGGRSGTVDVALSLGASATDASCLQPWTPGAGDAATAGANLAYLRGAWCGNSQDKDPAARATFGQPRTLNHLLYRRENY